MNRATTQEIRDEITKVLKDKHGMDSFEVREFLGMMFCQAVVADARLGAIPDADLYIRAFAELVRRNLHDH